MHFYIYLNCAFLHCVTNEGVLPRQDGRVKSKGNAIGGIAWFLCLDLNFHSRVSINRGTLVFFLQTGMATGPGSIV